MNISRTDDEAPPSWMRMQEAAWIGARAWRGIGHLRPRGPGDGPPALVIPGFIANDRTTMELRRALAGGGWRVHPWQLGWNMGATADMVERLRARIDVVSPDQPLRPKRTAGWAGYGRVESAWASRTLD